MRARSDMWIHEGWTTYLECLYVEYMYGKDDGLKYTNGYKSEVRNQQPIIAQRGVNATPPQDMYFKGALFLNTLRNVVNDDARWWALLKEFYQHFKYQTIYDLRRHRGLVQSENQNESDADLR